MSSRLQRTDNSANHLDPNGIADQLLKLREER